MRKYFVKIGKNKFRKTRKNKNKGRKNKQTGCHHPKKKRVFCVGCQGDSRVIYICANPNCSIIVEKNGCPHHTQGTPFDPEQVEKNNALYDKEGNLREAFRGINFS